MSIRARLLEDFPGHAGVPGHRGGSAPRGGGQGSDPLAKAVRWKGAKVKKGWSKETLIKATRNRLAGTIKSYRKYYGTGGLHKDTAKYGRTGEYFHRLDIAKDMQKLAARGGLKGRSSFIKRHGF